MWQRSCGLHSLAQGRKCRNAQSGAPQASGNHSPSPSTSGTDVRPGNHCVHARKQGKLCGTATRLFAPIAPGQQRLGFDGLLAAMLGLLVAAYRLVLSPSLGGACRFTPSCSVYAQQALKSHGGVLGLYYTAWRLVRCHPWHRGAYHDDVPRQREPPKNGDCALAMEKLRPNPDAGDAL